MTFDITKDEATEKWGKWLAYTKDAEVYSTCVFADTNNEVGFLPKSDVICVFATKTGDLIAFIERVPKVDFTAFQRYFIKHRGKYLCKHCPYDYEGFVNDRGEFIEFQFYKRWWYDIARNIGNLAYMQFNEPISSRREDS